MCPTLLLHKRRSISPIVMSNYKIRNRPGSKYHRALIFGVQDPCGLDLEHEGTTNFRNVGELVQQHRVTSQNTRIFRNTIVRTSDLQLNPPYAIFHYD